jgi:hypothetical protein
VVVAEEGDHRASGLLLDGGDELVAHRALVGLPHGENQFAAAVGNQAALTLGERVAKDDAGEILIDGRPRLRWSSPGVSAHQLHHPIGDVRGPGERAGGWMVIGAGHAGSLLVSRPDLGPDGRRSAPFLGPRLRSAAVAARPPRVSCHGSAGKARREA